MDLYPKMHIGMTDRCDEFYAWRVDGIGCGDFDVEIPKASYE